MKIATALSAQRELRIHGRDEVIIIKPAARRYWMGVSALEDADVCTQIQSWKSEHAREEPSRPIQLHHAFLTLPERAY